jgi:hypothetical protein
LLHISEDGKRLELKKGKTSPTKWKYDITDHRAPKEWKE